jgi:BA14K-like protein
MSPASNACFDLKHDGAPPVFAVTNKGKIMTNKPRRAFIAIIVTAFGIASPVAAMAQSAYTSGSESSNVAAGYPSPYGGNGYYAYAQTPAAAAAPVTTGDNAGNCSRYHSYDPASGTYLGFDGVRHPCR